MYVAGYIVTGFLRRRRLRVRPAARALGPLRAHRAGDPADDRRAGLAGAGARSATGPRATSPRRSRSSWPRSRGSTRRRAARPSTCSAGTPTARSSTGSRSRTCSRCWPSTAGTRTVQGLDAVPADQRPPVNVVTGRVPADGRDRHAARAARASSTSSSGSGAGGCPSRAWFYRAVVLAGAAVGGGADRRLGRDRGRAPAVGRLPRDADRRRRSPARTGFPSATATLAAQLRRGRAAASSGCCAGWRARRSSCRPEPPSRLSGAA